MYVLAITGTVKAFYKSKDSKDVELGALKQGLNTFTSLDDGFKTFFLSIAGGSSVTLKYVKVEQGTVATSFIAPNMAEELVKCCRFYQIHQVMYTTYGVAGQHYYHKLPLVTVLRVNPTLSVTDQYNYNVKTKKIEWRSDGTGWLNLDVVAQSNDQTVCQLICACDAEIY